MRPRPERIPNADQLRSEPSTMPKVSAGLTTYTALRGFAPPPVSPLTFLLAPSGTDTLLCQQVLVVQGGERRGRVLLDPRVGLREGLHGAPGAVGEAAAAQPAIQSGHPWGAVNKSERLNWRQRQTPKYTLSSRPQPLPEKEQPSDGSGLRTLTRAHG